MAHHEGPLRCSTHRAVVVDDGCPIRSCEINHPLEDADCGDWCPAYIERSHR